MLKGFFGNNGTREHGPSLQVLDDERQALEDARNLAADGYVSQAIVVNGTK